MASKKFNPTHTGIFNLLQERLIARCIRKDMPVVEIVEQLKLQRDVAKKVENYPEFFSRSVFKKSVMVTANYGGSSQTSRDDVYDQLTAMESSILDDFSTEERLMLTNFVYDSMAFAIPCSFEYLEYSRELFAFVAAHKNGIMFVNPLSGMPVLVREEYIDKDEIAYKVNGKCRTAVLNRKTGEVNVRKTASTAIPGLIHSLDAAILLSIKSKLADVDMAYIHDSIATHPNKLSKARQAINDTLLEVFHSDALQKVVDQLLEGIDDDLIPDHLRKAPYTGDWLVEEATDNIMNSKYSFS